MTNNDRSSIRRCAEDFLLSHNFSLPPLDSDDALEAQGLQVAQLSLDDLIASVSLPAKASARIQAMLDTKGRFIVLRDGLHTQQQVWGRLHEIGHDALPWHHDLLYHCPLLWLPQSQQLDMELEADTFAAEVAFFGNHFQKSASELPFGLQSAVKLATETYDMSLYSTIFHYVLTSNRPCTLLVWDIVRDSSGLNVQGYRLHHYIRSETHGGPRIPPGQFIGTDHAIARAHLDSCGEVLSHRIVIGKDGGVRYQAQSFSNSYKLFTLVMPE